MKYRRSIQNNEDYLATNHFYEKDICLARIINIHIDSNDDPRKKSPSLPACSAEEPCPALVLKKEV